jgi:hypothetical protein
MSRSPCNMHQDLDGASAKATSTTAATAQGEALQGVPPLAASRVKLRWEADAAARAAVLAAERAGPSAGSLALRDASGHYSQEEPFWASLKSASILTAADSDRRVRAPRLPQQGASETGFCDCAVGKSHVATRCRGTGAGICL